MQLNTKFDTIDSVGMIANTDFTVRAGPHIMAILSGLYSNPADAIVREYLTNMYDAYVALQMVNPGAIIIPPKLKAPTALDPNIVFMDYGIGMDFDTVWEVFSQYGNSTKTHTNKMVGGLGIGSKTAFCYNNGSTWTIESRYNGTMHIFMACVGENGIPSLSHAASIPTDEHNGVTIKIPILNKDYDAVNTAIVKYAQYFPMEIEITGVPFIQGTNSPIPQHLILFQGTDWKLLERDTRIRSGLTIVMGNVPYAVNTYISGISNELSSFINNNRFIISVPVGSCDIVPSRDSLKFTEKTNKQLLTSINNLKAELESIITQEIEKCSNAWESIEVFTSYNRISHNNVLKITSTKFPNLFDRAIRFTLKEVRDALSLDRDKVTIYRVEGSYDGNIRVNVEGTDVFILSPTLSNNTIVINDTFTNGVSTLKAYIKEHMLSISSSGKLSSYGHKQCAFLFLDNKSLTTKQISDLFGGFPQDKILFTSTLNVKPKAVKLAIKADSAVCLRWNGSSWYGRQTAPSDTTIRYYLELTKSTNTGRWIYQGSLDNNHHQNARVNNSLTLANQLGIIVDSVYGIRSTDVTKFDGAYWVNLETRVLETAVTMVNTHKTEIISLYNSEDVLWDDRQSIISKYAPKLSDLDPLFAELLVSIGENITRTHKVNELWRLRKIDVIAKAISKILPANHRPSKEIFKDIKTKYPMFSLNLSYMAPTDHVRKVLREYIQLVLDK